MVKQRTLKHPAQISGVGLHSGVVVHLTIHPAAENTGIIFRRIDLQPTIDIPALTNFVSDTRLNTCLTQGGASVTTVEHILSALAGLGIDNARIELDAAEPPVMDGSAWPFIQAIQAAGIVEQSAAKQFIRIKQAITVNDGEKYVKLMPWEGFKFSMCIDFNHPLIAQTPQTLSIDLAQASYIEDISKARTFGFLSEYEFLRRQNLGLGASLDNTVVLNETALVNEGGLRYDAEFVKHKLLDAIGDLYLLGHNIIGEFSGYKSGHALNHQLRLALLQNTNAWEWVTQESAQSMPVDFRRIAVI